MIIYYDIDTKNIVRTEDNTLEPKLPANLNLEEKQDYYAKNNLAFIILKEELGIEIFKSKLIFDKRNAFLGIERGDEIG